jgi:hypothetical protein
MQYMVDKNKVREVIRRLHHAHPSCDNANNEIKAFSIF